MEKPIQRTLPIKPYDHQKWGVGAYTEMDMHLLETGCFGLSNRRLMISLSLKL